MTRFKDTWFCEFCKSSIFIGFLVFVLLIVGGVFISKCSENKKVIHMQEDVLYIKPKADTSAKK
jgi:hypothetical protein